VVPAARLSLRKQGRSKTVSPQQTVALMAMMLYACTQPRNLRPGDVKEDDLPLQEPSLENLKAAADEQHRELEACVSLAKKLYRASGAEQV